MSFSSIIFAATLLTLVAIGPAVVGQHNETTSISGYLPIDDTWEPVVYLSHISTFEEMHYMSSKMIIAEGNIDSLGYFNINLDFLPKAENLYRLHAVKSGNTPATLIIGGRDENHLFLIHDGMANLELTGLSSYAPFKNVMFKHSKQNNAIQHITNMVYQSDSIGSVSSASKRSLIEHQLHANLLSIADTSSNLLVSLYALYKSKFESNYPSNLAYYESFIEQRKDEDNTYYKAFLKRLPVAHNNELPATPNSNAVIIVVMALILGVAGFFLGKFGLRKNRKLKKLSVQERKVYELLLQSATNQEIADHLNIGLSTVKSHVNSIFSKLNVKSRKELLN